MFKRAQDMLGMVQDGVKTTMRVVADIAESVGVPPSVTSLLQPGNGTDQWKVREVAPHGPTPAAFTPAPQPVVAKSDPPAVASEPDATVSDPPAAASEPVAADDQATAPVAKAKMTSKRRPVVGDKERSKDVRSLEVDDAIDGSTYLARIIWSLGVAELEGLGPLRPADIARMVMSRSAVSLEPPNVARYIRRSKPISIAVAHVEGGSNFYQLNDKGEQLFGEYFRG